MKKMHTALVVCALGVMPFASASVDAGQKSLLNKVEERFVVEKMMDLMLEIRLSNQVLLTSTSPKLQFIAKNNVSFYSGLAIEWKAFAVKNKVDLPTQLDVPHMNVWNRISPLRGAEQAQAYLQFTSTLEVQLGVRLKHMANHAKSAELRAFARQQAVVLAKKR